MEPLSHRILDAALPLVPFDGWTTQTLEQAARNIGLTAFDAKRSFPGGVADAVALFCAQADAAMCDTLAREHDLAAMKIRTRIATAVMLRLRQQMPHREAVRRAIGFYSLPWNIAAGSAALYATVDSIWRAAGDTSTDYNFYTKRLMLAGVLQSTLYVWFDDASETLTDTEAFLHRRIENVMQIEKAKARARNALQALSGWIPCTETR